MAQVSIRGQKTDRLKRYMVFCFFTFLAYNILSCGSKNKGAMVLGLSLVYLSALEFVRLSPRLCQLDWLSSLQHASVSRVSAQTIPFER